MLLIPDYLPSRQGKSLDNTLESTLLMALMAHYVFVMRLPDHRKLLDQSHQPIRPIANARKTPFPWAV